MLPLNKAKFGSHFISAFLLISCVALLLISACVPTFELKVTIQNQPLLTLGKIAYINGGDIWIYDLDNSQTTRLTHGALSGTGPNNGMQFIDKEDDLAVGMLHFFDGGLEAFLELPAEAGTGDHASDPGKSRGRHHPFWPTAKRPRNH